MAKPPTTKIAVAQSVSVWALVLFAFAAASVAYLTMSGIHPDTDFSPVIIFMAYTPSLAAILVAWLLPRSGGLKALLKTLLVWRMHPAWYAAALLGPLALVIIAILLFSLTGGVVPAQCLVVPAGSDLGAMMGPLFAGMIGEELGWRGFAQRLLAQRLNVLVGGVIVGILWATWHQWTGLAPGGHLASLDVAEAYIRLIATAIIYGWMLARTGSVLLVMLAHAGHNIAVDLLPSSLLSTTAMPLIIALLYLAVAVTLVLARPAQFLRRS